jgi:small subunit ribosomal protein S2
MVKLSQLQFRKLKKLEIPIICIVDSNTDPTLCEYPIPANDDSIRTIQLLINEIVNTIISASKKDEDKTEETVNKDSNKENSKG